MWSTEYSRLSLLTRSSKTCLFVAYRWCSRHLFFIKHETCQCIDTVEKVLSFTAFDVLEWYRLFYHSTLFLSAFYFVIIFTLYLLLSFLIIFILWCVLSSLSPRCQEMWGRVSSIDPLIYLCINTLPHPHLQHEWGYASCSHHHSCWDC